MKEGEREREGQGENTEMMSSIERDVSIHCLSDKCDTVTTDYLRETYRAIVNSRLYSMLPLL